MDYNSVLFAPHNDDAELFACYTLIREKPLVIIVTDGYIQGERGDPITAEQRREESQKAADLIGYPLLFMGIKDTELTGDLLREYLDKMDRPDKVYIPAIQGGNWQHDLIGSVLGEYFPEATRYTTYTKNVLWTKGRTEVIPTQEEIDLKNKALDMYVSQIQLPATAPHFLAVRNKSEYYE